MGVSGEIAVKAKHPLIAVQFKKWFIYLDSIGIFAFGLFLGSLGAGESKYFCALISSFIVGWMLYVGKKNFPVYIEKLRKSGDGRDKEFEKELMKEQFKLLAFAPATIPYWIGLASLLSLVLQPFMAPQDFSLFLPAYVR